MQKIRGKMAFWGSACLLVPELLLHEVRIQQVLKQGGGYRPDPDEQYWKKGMPQQVNLLGMLTKETPKESFTYSEKKMKILLKKESGDCLRHFF